MIYPVHPYLTIDDNTCHRAQKLTKFVDSLELFSKIYSAILETAILENLDNSFDLKVHWIRKTQGLLETVFKIKI